MTDNLLVPIPGPRNIEWVGDASSGHLRLLDQTRLPGDVVYLECKDVQMVWDAIKRLSVRGAPAIGVAAAFPSQSIYLEKPDLEERARLDARARSLLSARPRVVDRQQPQTAPSDDG